MAKSNNILPPPKAPANKRQGKQYLHVLLDPEVIKALKLEAHRRNYNVGELLEHVLQNVLPALRKDNK